MNNETRKVFQDLIKKAKHYEEYNSYDREELIDMILELQNELEDLRSDYADLKRSIEEPTEE